jgi:hypothetical protein
VVKQEVVGERAMCGSTVNGVAFRVLDPIVFARPCDSILGVGTSIDQTVGPLDKHVTAIGVTKHAPDLGVRVIGVHASFLRQVDETVVAGGWETRWNHGWDHDGNLVWHGCGGLGAGHV